MVKLFILFRRERTSIVLGVYSSMDMASTKREIYVEEHHQEDLVLEIEEHVLDADNF